MSRKVKKWTGLPWLSGKANYYEDKSPYVQIQESVWLSPAFQALSESERFFYFTMCMAAKGHKEFEFPAKAFEKYGIPEATARRHITKLLKAGFIQRDSGWNTRTPNKFKFIEDWKK